MANVASTLRKKNRRFFVKHAGSVWIVGILLATPVQSEGARSFVDDYLRPVQEVQDAQSPEAAYERLWRQKLLVTSGEIARSVQLPGNVGVETAISISRKPLAKRVEYWVTATQTSLSLWGCVATDATQPVNPESIKVTRADAKVPNSTALLVQKAWLAMLRQVRARPPSNEIMLDRSTEIFSALGPDGKLLLGQFEGIGQGNAAALSELAGLLLQYCDAPDTERADIVHKIDKAALNLLGRVAFVNGSKKHNPKSTSSSKVAISPRKENISQPIADGRSVRPQSVTRLGSSIGDFVSIWGPPSRKETLARTASLKWKRHGANGEPVVPGAFAVEVAFLDGIAREIALRSTHRITPQKLVKLAKPFVTTFSRADFVKADADADAFPAYRLSDGTFVWANKHKKHTVIVIKSPGYSRNEELSNREPAQVRPPTSNH